MYKLIKDEGGKLTPIAEEDMPARLLQRMEDAAAEGHKVWVEFETGHRIYPRAAYPALPVTSRVLELRKRSSTPEGRHLMRFGGDEHALYLAYQEDGEDPELQAWIDDRLDLKMALDVSGWPMGPLRLEIGKWYSCASGAVAAKVQGTYEHAFMRAKVAFGYQLQYSSDPKGRTLFKTRHCWREDGRQDLMGVKERFGDLTREIPPPDLLGMVL